MGSSRFRYPGSCDPRIPDLGLYTPRCRRTSGRPHQPRRHWLCIGVYFSDCPSPGHDMICLDYRKCGPKGETSVVQVDQEWDYRITFLAETFESFIRGLYSEAAFDN